MARGFARWEISLSFLAGVFVTALLFNVADPTRFAGPFFHLFAGYTLVGAFFLATEDASSPVNFIPMLIYGAGAGFLTVLIRNIGAYSTACICPSGGQSDQPAFGQNPAQSHRKGSLRCEK